MVTIGVDAHKRVHHALALNDGGTILGQWRGTNTHAGWQCLAAWAATFPGPQQWGIEGAWNYGRGVAQYLVAREETVYEINPRWTAERRRSARKMGKSDRLDAHAVAKLVREEGSTLPRVTLEDETAVLDLLVTEREAALAEATRLRNQLHQLRCRSTRSTVPPSRVCGRKRECALRKRMRPSPPAAFNTTAPQRSGGWHTGSG